MGVVWLLAACCFTLSCAQQFIMGIPASIAASTGVSVAAVGQLMTVFSISNAVGTPLLLAFVSRRIRPRGQLLLGLALLMLGLVAMALSDDYRVLVAARIVMGVGNGIFTCTAMATAAILASHGRQASAISNVILGFSAAMVLGMPIARTLDPYVGWHALYGILCAVAVLSAALVARFVPAMVGPEDETADTSGPTDAAENPASSLRSRFALLANPAVAPALMTMVLVNIGFSGYYTYVTPFLEGTFGTGAGTVSLVLLVSSLMSIVGSKGSGWLADHVGYKPTAVTALCIQILSLAVLGALHAVPLAVWVAMCAWVTADWGFNPAQNLMLTKLAGDDAPMVLSLSGSALQLGNAVGSALGGAFITVAPISALPFLAVCAISIALLVEVLVVFRRVEG